jgi:hypothetical protein
MENDQQPTPASDAKVPARYQELRDLVAAMAGDFDKFYTHGNKAAGTRIRVSMQQLKVFAQTVRTEVQTLKNDGKTPS